MSITSTVKGFFGRSAPIGLDIGSCSIRISLPRKNTIVVEPAMVVKNVRSDRIVAVGKEARRISGRTPAHIQAISPVVAGEIEDSAAFEALLSILLYRETSGLSQVFGRKILVSLPAGVTDVSCRIVEKTLEQVRGQEITAVSAAVSGLVGVGAPVGDPTAQAVLNLGCGLSQAAAVSDGQVIAEASSTLAGEQFDRRIQQYILDEYGVRISDGQAREIKHTLGAVRGWSKEPGETMTITGQEESGNLPQEITLARIDITEALEPMVTDIVDFAREFISGLSTDVAADLSAHGIYLIGGTARLSGLAEHIGDELGLTVHTRVAPEKTIIEGLSYIANREDSASFSQPITAYETAH